MLRMRLLERGRIWLYLTGKDAVGASRNHSLNFEARLEMDGGITTKVGGARNVIGSPSVRDGEGATRKYGPWGKKRRNELRSKKESH